MLYSVRMRASQKSPSPGKGQANKERSPGIHISGAEGLYGKAEIGDAVDRYIKRALEHPRGDPDRISLTVEKVSHRPRQITSLALRTADTATVRQAQTFVQDMLRSLLISAAAIDRAFELLSSSNTMRGAALLDAASGKRLEPDQERGIRVSRLGLSRTAETELQKRLARLRLNTGTVREAVVLASKVASCRPVLAELCISDDPDYTTGYIASRSFGYIRIPYVKKKRSRSGGRIFFMRGEYNLGRIIAYLEKTPVLISTVALCSGISTTDELLGHRNL
ncbi:MAG: 6-carboxyhexanoate--CoA ligase [Thermodesulfovibrio sp.]|nr:6-carboxyhexanoate--CoA ligase [Thermodesulfovibrio sp.]